MTNEEIRIAVAEEMEWSRERLAEWQESVETLRKFQCAEIDEAEFYAKHLRKDVIAPPDYPTSLDACAEFEATLDSSELYDYYYEHLYATVKPSGAHHSMQVFCATARQRCEAFLRLRGRWKEDER